MISPAFFRFGKVVEVLLDVGDLEGALLQRVFADQIRRVGSSTTSND